MVAKQESDSERARELRQHRRDRVLWRCAALDLPRHEVAHHLRVGLALERAPLGDELVAERLEVLDMPLWTSATGPTT